jgi:hypothetical protein
MCRPARRESSDQRHIGPSAPESGPGMGRQGRAILGEGSGRPRERATGQCMTDARAAVESRNPTAVQSGNRSATPFWVSGRDEEIAGNRLCESFRKERLMLSGPRRAQAGSYLPTASARDQRSGSARRTCSRTADKQSDTAHAVTSRVTSWAFWFLRPAISAIGFNLKSQI